MSKKYNFRLNDKKKKDCSVSRILEERKRRGHSYTDTIVAAIEAFYKKEIGQ